MFYLDYVNNMEKSTETTDYCQISSKNIMFLRYKQQDPKKSYSNGLLVSPGHIGDRRLVPDSSK